MSKRFAATKGREAVVSTMPNCDLCANGTKAVYDGKTQMGPWAYMCERHYQNVGVGLGEGMGQKLYTSDIS
jgi:hypothetical protein